MKGLLNYFQGIWRRRHFWLSLVRVDLRARYRGSAFGMGWSLLQPIAMTAILCAVFATIFHQDLAKFAPYLMSGLTCWTFMTTTALMGCQCYFVAESYIRQHPVPMAIYPLRTMLAAAFHFCMGFLLVIVLSLVCNGFNFIGPLGLLSLAPSLAILMTFGWALAILFGLATVRFRDIRQLTEVGFQALFYLTPVMYPAEQMKLLAGRRTVGWLFCLNPFVPFLEMVRAPVVYGQAPDASTYGAALLITLAAVVAAGLALKAEERKIIFHL